MAGPFVISKSADQYLIQPSFSVLSARSQDHQKVDHRESLAERPQDTDFPVMVQYATRQQVCGGGRHVSIYSRRILGSDD